MRLTTDWAEWPEWVDVPVGSKPVPKVGKDSIAFTFINHSTVLIQSNGYNILTDPHYSKRASPYQFAGPARVHQAAVRFEDLPPIHIVIISHDHYDHLDIDTIERIVEAHNPKIYMGLGVSHHFSHDTRKNMIEMDWWDRAEFSDKLAVNFVEVKHFSGRWLFDRDKTLWGGFVLEVAGKKIYFGGDTGYGDHFQRTFQRYGEMDFSLIPIGAYAPRSFMGPIHLTPEEAVQAHLDLRSRRSFGVHFGTFQLSAEPIDEAKDRLINELGRVGLGVKDFGLLPLGEAKIFPHR